MEHFHLIHELRCYSQYRHHCYMQYQQLNAINSTRNRDPIKKKLILSNAHYLVQMSITGDNIEAGPQTISCQNDQFQQLNSPIGVHVLRQIVLVSAEHGHRLQIGHLLPRLALRLAETGRQYQSPADFHQR